MNNKTACHNSYMKICTVTSKNTQTFHPLICHTYVSLQIKVYTFSFKDPKNLVSCDVAYLCHTMRVSQDHTYLKNRSPSQVLSSITPLISCIKIAWLVLYWPIWEGVKPFLASLYICSLTSSAVNLSHWYKNHNKRYTKNQHKWYS